jgi:hypothetical protein
MLGHPVAMKAKCLDMGRNGCGILQGLSRPLILADTREVQK